MRNSLALLVTAAIAGWSTQVSAAPVCDKRDAIVDGLANRYGEEAQSIGLTQDGNVLEIFASEAGTWTAVITSPRGRACIIAAGEAWEQKSSPAGHLIHHRPEGL